MEGNSMTKQVEFEYAIQSVKYSTKIQRKDYLEDGVFPIVSQESELINGFWNDEKDVFRNDTGVVIFGDHTRVLKFVDFDFVLGADGSKILKPVIGLDCKYFYYQLMAFEISSIGYARHFRLLKEKKIKMPPLAEQQRIVARLDAAFAAIAEASAAAEANLRNARALFDSYLDQVFSQRGAGWVERRLPDISENQDSRRKPVTRNLRNNGEYPYFGASGVVDYVDDYIFEENNLLISEDGANLLARSTPIAFTVKGKYWVNNHAHVLHFTDADLQKFIEFYFAHIDITEYVTGAAQPKLTQKALNNIPVFHPTNPETLIKLVEGMEFINNESKGLCDVYKQKLAALTELKQSLLAEVFGA